LEKPGSLLELRGVRAGYGDAVVLDDVSLEVARNGSLAGARPQRRGQVRRLLFTIMGYTRLQAGTILFNGHDITALPPHRRAQLGIGWVAQEREIFPSLTLEENLAPWPRARGAGAWARCTSCSRA
jgi:branched-chain amino acid transport system ATP-binding protein